MLSYDVFYSQYYYFGFSQVGYFTGSKQQNLPASILSDLDDVLVPVIHSAANNQRVHSLSIELLFKVLRLLWQTQLSVTSLTLMHFKCCKCMQNENMAYTRKIRSNLGMSSLIARLCSHIPCPSMVLKYIVWFTQLGADVNTLFSKCTHHNLAQCPILVQGIHLAIGNYMVLWVLGDTQCLNATLFCGAADSLKHSEHSLGIKVTM